MTSPAMIERALLCDLFEEVGPDAPTLAGEWTTRDLAAHLVVRERRPDGAIGILFAPFADHAEKVRRAEASKPWPDLIARVRKGPPLLSPTRIDVVDRLVNSIEFCVHHEDVRRAQPPWNVRDLPADLNEAMLVGLRRAGPLLREVAGGVTLVATDVTDDAGAPTTIVARDRQPMVTVTGATGELALFAFGRQPAQVSLDGDPVAVAALTAAQRGI